MTRKINFPDIHGPIAAASAADKAALRDILGAGGSADAATITALLDEYLGAGNWRVTTGSAGFPYPLPLTLGS